MAGFWILRLSTVLFASRRGQFGPRTQREARSLRSRAGRAVRGEPARLRGVLLSQGEVQALFLRHEGYLGAIGAFLKGAEQDSE